MSKTPGWLRKRDPERLRADQRDLRLRSEAWERENPVGALLLSKNLPKNWDAWSRAEKTAYIRSKVPNYEPRPEDLEETYWDASLGVSVKVYSETGSRYHVRGRRPVLPFLKTRHRR